METGAIHACLGSRRGGEQAVRLIISEENVVRQVPTQAAADLTASFRCGKDDKEQSYESAVLSVHSRSSLVPWAFHQPIRARLCRQRLFYSSHLAAEDQFRNLRHTCRISLAASRRLAEAFRA